MFVYDHPFGSLRVKFVDKHGDPVQEELEIRLTVGQGTERPFVRTVCPEPGAALVEPCVGAGLKKSVMAKGGPVPGIGTAFLNSPSTMGERVESTVTVNGSLQLFEGRISSPRGVRVPDGETIDLLLVINNHETPGNAQFMADGRFRVGFSSSAKATTSAFIVARTKAACSDPTLEARVAVELPSRGETRELGNLQLASSRSVCRGQVIDVGGGPAPDATVILYQQASAELPFATLAVTIEADSMGHFEAPLKSAGSGRLAVQACGFSNCVGVSDRVPVQAGMTVTLKLEPSAKVRGSLVLPEGYSLKGHRMRLKTRCFGPSVELESSIDRDGGFRFHLLRAGTIDLAIGQLFRGGVLVRSDGLSLDPGDFETNAGRVILPEIELAPWDLRGELRAVAFTMEFPDHMPRVASVQSGQYKILVTGESFSGLLPAQADDFLVSAFDCRTVRYSIDAVPEVIVLKRGYECVVELDLPPEHGPYMLRLRRPRPRAASSAGFKPLTLEDFDSPKLARATNVDADGRATLFVGESGSFEVVVMDRGMADIEEQKLPPNLHGRILLVVDHDSTQRFDLR